MEIQQNPTAPKSAQELAQHETNDLRYAALIDFKALNGLITTEEGVMKKTSMQVFADMIAVDRTTLYAWMKRPGFWDNVNSRRNEISGGGRLARVHETLYLKAVAGEWQFTNAFLLNFDPNYKTPTTKVEHEASDSFFDALGIARSRQQVIEGEIVDDSPQET